MGVVEIGRRRRAVFLDRDGVLTELVRHSNQAEKESPHSIDELRLRPNAASALRRLQRLGYDLFVVSNQPSYAKGKASLEDLRAVADEFESRLAKRGVVLRGSYYCFHHPEGVVPRYTRRCPCRKPSPYFLKLAARRFGVDLKESWMIGDRQMDVDAGKRAGCRTILIGQGGSAAAALISDNVQSAARLIAATSRGRNARVRGRRRG